MPHILNGETYLDVDEAAELLGVKKATLYAYVSRGMLRSYRQAVGRRRLYRKGDVEALRAIQGSPAVEADVDDGVLRDVHLPDVETWAGEH